MDQPAWVGRWLRRGVQRGADIGALGRRMGLTREEGRTVLRRMRFFEGVRKPLR